LRSSCADDEAAMTKRRTAAMIRIGRHWERLGAEDPLWAVYVAPGTRGGAWDVERFFATGRDELEQAFAVLEPLGVPAAHGTALDFGCGVGRLSRPLRERFDRVVGVDVSEPMLVQARKLERGAERIEFVLNRREDLSFLPDGEVDLVYSSLVLQHLPKRLAARYLCEFVRVLAPGGAAVVQVATRPTRSVKGWAFRVLPPPVTGLLQRVLLGYPAPMRMQAMSGRWLHKTVRSAGGSVLAEASDPTYQGHWIYTRYVIGRESPSK
jgi:ubiquinone/menaquinone biosynthesis C-methylase UbiE